MNHDSATFSHTPKNKQIHLDSFKMQYGLGSTASSALRKCCEYLKKIHQGSETDVLVGFTSTVCFFQGTVNMIPESWQILHWLPIAGTCPQGFGWKSYGYLPKSIQNSKKTSKEGMRKRNPCTYFLRCAKIAL